MSSCANACFAVTYAKSTVPYYSLDVPRSITLMYSSAVAAVRPIITAYVHDTTSKTIKEYWLQAPLNGSTLVTFLNGDTKLRFAAPTPQSATARLIGQFDARTLPTNAYRLYASVTSVYTDGTSLSTTFAPPVTPVINGITSPVGRGWFIAGVQRLYVTLVVSNMIAMVTNGDGTASTYFDREDGTFTRYDVQDNSTLTSTGCDTCGTNTSLTFVRTYPDSSRVEFDYLGYEVRRISAQGDTTSFAYDAAGRLTRVYDPYRTYSGGNRSYISLHYDANGLLDQIQEPGGDGTPGTGRATQISHAADSTVTAITDPDGIAMSFGYNSNKLLSRLISRRGDTTRYTYDPNSWLVDSIINPRIPIDAGGGNTALQTPVITYTPWQDIGIPTTSTTINLAPLTPPSSIRASLVDPAGRIFSYTVNRLGLPLVVSGPMGQSVSVTRDPAAARLPVKTVYSSGGVDTMAYAPQSTNVVYSKLAGDSAWNFSYSAAGKLDSVWGNGQLALRTFLRTTSGVPDSTRIGGLDSLMTRYTYDSRRRVLTVQELDGSVTTYQYDATFGNVDSVKTSNGLVAVRRFDAYGRDTADFVTGALYWNGMRYDAQNRMVKRWHRGVSNDTTTTVYDALFAVRMQAPGGSIYKILRNALGWTTASYDAVDTTKFTSYRYDPVGRLTSWTNRRNQRITVTYDSLNRPLVRSGSNLPTDSTSYSADGRIIRSTRAGVSLDSVFLSLSGAPDSVIHRLAGHRYAFRYAYASYDYGQRVSDTIVTDAGIPFVRQAQAWRPATTTLDSVAIAPGAGSGSAVWMSSRAGDVEQIRQPGGVATKLRSFTVRHQLITESVGYVGNTVNDSLYRDFARDTLGHITAEQHKTSAGYLSRLYVYDGFGHLLKVQRQHASMCTIPMDSVTGKRYSCSGVIADSTADSAGYDIAGNRTMAGSAYTATGNRLLTWPAGMATYAYTYDADGNVATRTHGGVTDSLFWNAANQLDSVRSGGLRRRYEYDPTGQLVRRSTNGKWDRHFLWDGGQLVAELDSAGTHRQAQYLYHGETDHPYAIITDSAGAPLIRALHQDALGNVTGVIRATRLDQYTEYTAWGQVDRRPINALADTNRLGWKGLMYEGDSTRLYFVRNRWYDPQVGRFVSEDPIGLSGGTNLYTFAGSDPVNGRDPTGTTFWKEQCQTRSFYILSYDFCSYVTGSAVAGGNYFGCTTAPRRIYLWGRHCAVETYWSNGIDFQRYELIPNVTGNMWTGMRWVVAFPNDYPGGSGYSEALKDDGLYDWVQLAKVSPFSLSFSAWGLTRQWADRDYYLGDSNVWACSLLNNLNVSLNEAQAARVSLQLAYRNTCRTQYDPKLLMLSQYWGYFTGSNITWIRFR